MWRSININKSLIKASTSKSAFIACPHNSEYDGYAFWHPQKLIREGRHGGAVSIRYTEDFVFYLKKYSAGRDVVDEIPLAYDEFEEIFGAVNENIHAPHFKSEYETHKPEAMEAVPSEADESLIDDE